MLLAATVLLLWPLAGATASPWPPATCRAQADKIAGWSHALLLHYRAVSIYPAAMSYLLLRDSLARYESHRCPRRTLGVTLERSLKRRQRTKLLSLLPRAIARTLRADLAAAP